MLEKRPLDAGSPCRLKPAAALVRRVVGCVFSATGPCSRAPAPAAFAPFPGSTDPPHLPAQAWGLEGICVHRSANTGKRGASGAPSLNSPLPKQGFSLGPPPCCVLAPFITAGPGDVGWGGYRRPRDRWNRCGVEGEVVIV